MNRRDLSTVFKDQGNDFDYIKLTFLNSFTVNTNPKSDNEVSSKNCVDELLYKNTNPRFNQSLPICSKITAGNTDFNYTNYGTIQVTDTTKVKTGNAG